MSTTTWTKTQNQTLLSLQSVASNTVVLGTALDVSTKAFAFVGIHFGRRTISALTTGAKIRIEGSVKSSGDGQWFSLYEYQSGVTAAESEAVSGTCNAGQKVINVASTTNLTVGSIIFIDNSTIGNSEWARIKSVVTNTSITVEDDLVNAQTGSTIYNQGDIIAAGIDLRGIGRIRAVANFADTGQACSVEILTTTADSLTTA